jgi:uncharacterized membrane protein YcaP (DUF421 family)
MLRSRISPEELIGELRQSGISDIQEVRYAILEQNGKISVIPKSSEKPVTPKQMGINITDNGIDHVVINNGRINAHALTVLGMTNANIENILNSKKLSKKEVYLMLIDDSGNIKIFNKEK